MEEHHEVFILLKDKPGEKLTNVVMRTIFGNTPCNVPRGELAIKTDPEKPKSEEEPLNYRTVYTDQPAMFQYFDDDIAVAPLLGNQAPLLAGVKSKEERYKLFITKGRLECGSSLKMNDPVVVSFKDSQAAETEVTRKATAVIQYVGPVKGEKGIMFGVEIVEPHFFGQGNTNGTVNGEHYFTCREGNGMFVSFDRLSKLPIGGRVPDTPHSQSRDQPVVQTGGKKGGKKKEKPFRFQPCSVPAVGIETDVKDLGTDMESCLPAKHHYFSVGKMRSQLFVHEDELMLENEFVNTQRPQQQQSTEPSSRSSKPPPPYPQQHSPQPKPAQIHYNQQHQGQPGMWGQPPSQQPGNMHLPPELVQPGPLPPTTAGLDVNTRPSHSGSKLNQPGEAIPPGLGKGSFVQLVGDPSRHGVIKWTGTLPEAKGPIAGVELNEPMEGCGDGEWKGCRYFTCLPGRAFFCPVTSLRPDPRIPQVPQPVHSSVQGDPQQIALQVQKYKRSRGLPIEGAVREAGLLISDIMETGTTLGTGSYGKVIEVQVRGRRCAAKKLHGVFVAQDVPPKEKSAITERFETECRRVLYLSHPNIIEMIGIHFDRATRLPTLVMELMDTSLCKYLENNTKFSVALSTKYSILHDVASGLVYLHSLPPPLGPIVHRDLTANNILLALSRGMVAKIADLGQAKIDSKYATRQQQLSQVPGNDDHMPPEAWLDNPVYNSSLDVFSFGVVMLHTLTHEWPKPLGRFKTSTAVRLEVDRRKDYLDKISSSPLKPLVVQCLSQEPGDRPTTTDIFHVLERHINRFHGSHRGKNPLKDVPTWEEEDQTIAGDQIQKYTGDKRGIQGHQNSCYLDATIFGLFALSDVFDSLFLVNLKSITHTSLQSPTAVAPIQTEIGDMLWKGIVNPLRKYGVVKFESVMQLRNKLEQLGKMEGVNTKEKDPEEFLNMLFKHTLHVDPFIHIKRPSGTEPDFFVQLFVELDKSLKVPTIEALLRNMFKEQHISFSEVPSKLLVLVPKYGKQFQRIIPEITLDTSPLLDTPKKCFICNEAAQVNCQECGTFFCLNNSRLCDRCSGLVHKHPARVAHKPKKREDVPELELLSVLCIETSHYVCFSRDNDGRWLFFDSMADRLYDQFNIPRGVECTAQLNEWVYEGDQERLMAAGPRELPELVRRFTQDVYMCVYIQPDYGMYG